MKIFPALLSLSLSALLFAGCGKDDDNNNQTTKADLLASAPWLYENAGVDNNRDGTIDANLSVLLPGAVPQCRLDNSISFKKDNTGVTDEGISKCTAADPQTSPFNWSFADNETSLTINNNVFSLLNGKARIVALTDKSLSLTRDTTLSGLGTLALVVTLKH